MFDDGISSLRDTLVELLLIFVITLEDDEPFFERLEGPLLPCRLYDARFAEILLSTLFVFSSYVLVFVFMLSTRKKLLTALKHKLPFEFLICVISFRLLSLINDVSLLRENRFSLSLSDIFLFEFLLWLKLFASLFEFPNWFGFTINTDLLPICFT